MDHVIPKSKSKIIPFKKRRHIAQHFSISKNGVITGAADNDPATIATFIQVGATTGLALAWFLALITPLAIAIEETSAKIGIIANKGLTALIRQHYGIFWAGLVGIVVLVSNTITIGADIAVLTEVVGSITHIPWFWIAPLIVIGFSILLLKNSYATISRYLIFFTLTLLLYFVVVWLVDLDGKSLLTQLWPKDFNAPPLIISAMALLGTIISPYLIFWQTTEEVESKLGIKSFYRERLGVAAGFIYTSLIALAIILISAVTFADRELVNSVTEAALTLKPLLGHWALVIFSLGIISSGLLGIPVLAASSAYVGAEIFTWPEGLGKKLKRAKGFYILIIGSLLVGGIIALTRIPPMIMLFYTQVINSMLSPVLIVFLLLIANNKKIMGKNVNGFGHNFLSLIAIGLMIILATIWVMSFN